MSEWQKGQNYNPTRHNKSIRKDVEDSVKNN